MTADDHEPDLLSPPKLSESRRVADILRDETVGGLLLIVAAVAALVWANTASHNYESLVNHELGPDVLHLQLSVGHWAGDGLLALFFFVAGLELKREFTAGDLREPRRAAVPVAAAIGGVVLPSAIFAVINLGGNGDTHGWAIPAATDIAFALAVLAVIGSALPSALRTFLLTLAVVDDLLAIVIIAVVYTSNLAVGWLLLALVPLALFGLLAQLRTRLWWLMVPLALLTWIFMHASGVHATVAGVLLAFTIPVRSSPRDRHPDHGMAETLEHALRPLSSALAVPVFALFSAGVAVGGVGGLGDALRDRVAIGVVAGLVVGKTVGVFGATWLVARFTGARLDPDLEWVDVFGLSVLCGVGFTVSLLITELAFGSGSGHVAHAKVAVLAGSILAALLAAIVLRMRNTSYRRAVAKEPSLRGRG